MNVLDKLKELIAMYEQEQEFISDLGNGMQDEKAQAKLEGKFETFTLVMVDITNLIEELEEK